MKIVSGIHFLIFCSSIFIVLFLNLIIHLSRFTLAIAWVSNVSAGKAEEQAGIKIARRNINKLRYADDTMLMAESEEELKSLLKVKEESEKVGLKLNVQKTKITVSGPITSWHIDGETV